MKYKTLSVKQPYAALICAGVKTVENRTWSTDYRGKLLIHASGKPMPIPDSDYLPEKFQKEFFRRWDTWDWEDAPVSMIGYYNLLYAAWNFYGKAIDKDEMPSNPQKFIKQAVKEKGFFLYTQSIIGFCDLVDCVQNSKDDFADKGDSVYHWILSECYMFDKPVTNVFGHLRVWNFEVDFDLYEQ
jgi:hypothetical protein